eukprot:410247-Prorocentrum_minimum.AAC.6
MNIPHPLTNRSPSIGILNSPKEHSSSVRHHNNARSILPDCPVTWLGAKVTSRKLTQTGLCSCRRCQRQLRRREGARSNPGLQNNVSHRLLCRDESLPRGK